MNTKGFSISLLFITLFSLHNVSALILLQHYQPAGHRFVGEFSLNHSTLLHNNTLTLLIDNNIIATANLSDYLPNITEYDLKDIAFKYRVLAIGNNSWKEHPNITFKFRIKANCTNMQWENQTDWMEARVSADDGLKFIINGINYLSPPSGCKAEWFAETNTSDVLGVMREACGNQAYSYMYETDKDGWVRRTLLCTDTECNQGVTGCGGSKCSANWEKDGYDIYKEDLEAFDNTSFDANSELFCDKSIGKCGGIYKGGVKQSWGEVFWNGSVGSVNKAHGYIKIKNYDNTKRYEIVYFPPNGPKFCAWTDYNITKIQEWKKQSQIEHDGNVNLLNPYTAEIQYTQQEFPQPPECPPWGYDCQKMIKEYTINITTDKSKLQVFTRFKNSILHINITTNSTELAHNYTFKLDLSKLPVKVPESLGEHNLTIMIMKGQQIVWQGLTNFSVCKDFDKDGFCKETGDCDETNSKINPGAKELCNGIDDDCDGKIDEDFWKAGTKLGQPCSAGACKGYYVCTPDGSGVVCSGAKPTPEICGDGIDNDCDGVVDEEMEWVGGKARPACFCKPGDTKPCGSNVGRCRQGYMICRNYSWSECIDSVQPIDEVCNGIDDNCDGIIDNVGKNFGVSSSVKESRCGCYGGRKPSKEVCNDIDDDCNGEIDEGLNCCKSGETRSCSEAGYLGECAKGIQNCTDGAWSECSIKPQDEICYDGLDNDCDGEIDENCDPKITCKNGVKDLNEEGIDCGGPCRPCMLGEMPGTWIAVAVIGIVIVLVIGTLGFKGVI